MTQPLVVEYKGIEISYSEGENVWNFELRGRSRKADSLAKAKEYIDKPAPEEKTFKRSKAFIDMYGDGFAEVDVTSIAEGSRWSKEIQFWTIRNGNREKQEQPRLIAFNDENKAMIAEHNRISEEIRELQKKQFELKQQMKRFVVEE